MKYEIYGNREKAKWNWRIVDDDGKVIARSVKATDHPGNCHVDIIHVGQIDPKIAPKLVEI